MNEAIILDWMIFGPLRYESSYLVVLQSYLEFALYLQISRLESPELLRRCRKLIRELNFKEKIRDNALEAVHYLRSKLSDTFDHTDPDERRKVCCPLLNFQFHFVCN